MNNNDDLKEYVKKVIQFMNTYDNNINIINIINKIHRLSIIHSGLCTFNMIIASLFCLYGSSINIVFFVLLTIMVGISCLVMIPLISRISKLRDELNKY